MIINTYELFSFPLKKYNSSWMINIHIFWPKINTCVFLTIALDCKFLSFSLPNEFLLYFLWKPFRESFLHVMNIVLLDDNTHIYVWTGMFAYFAAVVCLVQCARGPNQRLVQDQQITQQRSLETLTELYFTLLYYFGLEYASLQYTADVYYYIMTRGGIYMES